MKAIFE